MDTLLTIFSARIARTEQVMTKSDTITPESSHLSVRSPRDFWSAPSPRNYISPRHRDQMAKLQQEEAKARQKQKEEEAKMYEEFMRKQRQLREQQLNMVTDDAEKGKAKVDQMIVNFSKERREKELERQAEKERLREEERLKLLSPARRRRARIDKMKKARRKKASMSEGKVDSGETEKERRKSRRSGASVKQIDLLKQFLAEGKDRGKAAKSTSSFIPPSKVNASSKPAGGLSLTVTVERSPETSSRSIQSESSLTGSASPPITESSSTTTSTPSASDTSGSGPSKSATSRPKINVAEVEDEEEDDEEEDDEEDDEPHEDDDLLLSTKAQNLLSILKGLLIKRRVERYGRHVPEEVLCAALEYLPISDLLLCLLVCKKWEKTLSGQTGQRNWRLASSIESWGIKPPVGTDVNWKHLIRDRFFYERNWARAEYKEAVRNHGAAIYSVVFAGNILATGGADNNLKLWKLLEGNNISGKLIKTLTGHTGAINAIQLKGKHALTASSDTTIKIWDTKTGACQQTYSGHTSDIHSLLTSAQDNHIYSCSSDNTIREWDLETGKIVQTLSGHTASVRSLSLRRKELISGAFDGSVRQWDLTSGQCVNTIKGDEKIYSVYRQGGWILSAGSACKINIYEARSTRLIKSLLGHTKTVECVINEGKRVVSAGEDHIIYIWNAESGACLHKMPQTSPVHTIHSDVMRLVSGSHNGEIFIHDFASIDHIGTSASSASGGLKLQISV